MLLPHCHTSTQSPLVYVTEKNEYRKRKNICAANDVIRYSEWKRNTQSLRVLIKQQKTTLSISEYSKNENRNSVLTIALDIDVIFQFDY